MFFLAFVFSASGQQEGNPFDLKYRPRTSKPLPPPPETPIKEDTLPTGIQVIKADTSQPIFSTPAEPDSDNPFELKDDEIVTDTTGNIAVVVPEKEAAPKPILPVDPIKRPSKGIQIFFLLLSLLFLIFIVNVERSFVKDLWRVISNENYSSLHLRNQRNTMRQILLIMGYFVFILQAGVFLYHTLDVFNYKGTLLDNVWVCIALVMAVYIIRHAVIRYLRWLFNNDKEMTLFSFDISIFNIMVGLILLPVNVLLNFGPENLARPLIYMGLIVVALAYLMRQLRWVLTARHLISNSLFLFFVYLCAVEILPLWAISKFFW